MKTNLKTNLLFILSSFLFLCSLLLIIYICSNNFIPIYNLFGIVGIILLVILGLKIFIKSCKSLADELTMCSRFENKDF